ncbi:PAS domain-containing protein [Pontibacter korlensis]|uniref:histidine kinase n=1 Tax=Pontibacter korlensis TaxID=400092 RepID=A0A0E3ZGC7_9BACT|nr:PAS domain-containing protein [Pontibacter korlensis]AKD04065.1 phytochrome-like protein cph1 [Pontibacter korlensis]
MSTNSLSSSQEGISIQTLPFQKIFEAQSALVVLLSPDLVIQGATDNYLLETFMKREEIIGRNLFEVFPDNPDASVASTTNLKASFDQVFATRKSHRMDIFQYDIPDPNNQGSFIERFWTTVNTPVLNEQGEIICIIHETANVTDEVKARLELKESQEREKVALAQAEQQRLRLERLLDQAPAAFAMLEGPDLVYNVLNSSYQQLFPGREMLGLPLFEALPELITSPVYQIINNVYNTGETFEGKEVLIPVARYEGQPVEDIYWNFIYQALFDADGKVNGVLIFALDVTEFVEARKQVEKSAEALQELNRELEERVESRTQELRTVQAEVLNQKQQLESIFMQAPAAICILDGPELTYQLVNPGYQQIFPGRDLLGKPLMEALPELQGTTIPDLLHNVYQTGETYIAEELHLMLARHEDGPLEEMFWTFTYQARYNSEGAVDGILVYAHEVTSQVEVRKAIEASARQLQLVTDSLPVLISYLDKDERYRFVNRAYEGWFNLKVEDVLNKTAVEVVGEKAYKTVEGYIKRALAGEQLTYELAMPYNQGLRHTRTNFVPDIRDGKVAGFFALVSDVTDQVEARITLEKREKEAQMMAEKLATANEELLKANAELGVANKRLIHINTDLDNFIYTASHDLKAPISNIEMLMEELLVELPDETLKQQEVKSMIGMMKGAIARFKKTIASLTEISKLQQDSFSNAEKVNVEEVVTDVRLDLEQLIAKSEVHIETDVKGCITESFSEKNLRSIIYNLLSNSIKYSHPDRKPVVRITCHEEREFFVLKVQDNGLGLSPAQQGKLFSMFRRFHDHVEGSGVGLYMVKRIVDNAGGKIEVESEEGKGTSFSVYFRK